MMLVPEIPLVMILERCAAAVSTGFVALGLLLAQSGLYDRGDQCLLLGVKRTLVGHSDSQTAGLLKTGNPSKPVGR